MEAHEIADALSSLPREDDDSSGELQAPQFTPETPIENESPIIPSENEKIDTSSIVLIPAEEDHGSTSEALSMASVEESVEAENAGTHSEDVRPKWKKFLVSWILLAASTLFFAATITLSFLSSSVNPHTIFSEPGTTITVLNVGSTISVFLVGELLLAASDNLRWTLAARTKGVGLATFLGLGNATGLLKVAALFFSNLNSRDRMWCAQRSPNSSPFLISGSRKQAYGLFSPPYCCRASLSRPRL